MTHWKLKIALSVALTLFFCVPYFALQRLTIFPVRRLPLTAIDELVAFVPAWVWVYQSVYLLLSIVPWLSSSAAELNRYARGFVLLSSAGFLFFFFLPIQGPRPDQMPADPMFRFLVSYDAPLNSFPSLHVGLSVYTVLFAARMLSPRVIAGLSIWAAAIGFAAIATKQHYVVDLPAGALLAWACHRWTSLSRRRRSKSTIRARPEPWYSTLKGVRMLKRSGFVGLAILWIFCATAVAQQPPPSPNPQEEADHESLRSLKGIYEQAIRENRIELLQPHLHSDFHGVMVTGRAVNNFADLQQYWRDIRGLMGEGGTYTTTLNPERSTIVGDVALARGTTDDLVRTDDGKEYRFVTLWSATLQREGTAWKIRYVQGTMDPIDNPFVRDFSRRMIVRIASATLLAGIVVGIAFGLIWQRRRTRRAGS